MTRNTNTLLFVLFALALLAAMAPGTAQAQTPDGETPAVEEVCSGQSGAAFGLCNAYCEAMDCELLDDGDDMTWPSASEKACLRVLDNFIKITGMAEMPCECPAGTADCPCEGDQQVCDAGLSCDPVTETCMEDDCPAGTLGCPCQGDEQLCEVGLICDTENTPICVEDAPV